jgi:hypothetical protein
VSDQLDELLARVAEATGLTRSEYRDPIAAHSAEAVRRLDPWVTGPLGAFAVETIAPQLPVCLTESKPTTTGVLMLTYVPSLEPGR